MKHNRYSQAVKSFVRDLNVLGKNKMGQSQRTVMKRILEAMTWVRGKGNIRAGSCVELSIQLSHLLSVVTKLG